ncbi:MAG TPA: AraC family transcriptional regulator [Puia sp.]|jgi:AraC-like DNA-binding protein
MKCHLIHKALGISSSLEVQDYSDKQFLKVWHYHHALELNVILESTGTAFVGDSIERFEPGDIVLIGKNLPHLWENDKAYFEKGSRLIAKAHIIHFFENFAGGLLEIPEMVELHHLLERAKLGIKFTGRSNGAVIKKIAMLVEASGYEKIMTLIDILKILSGHRNYKVLSSIGYMNSFIGFNRDKLLPVYEYVMNNFRNEISLDEIAKMANMNSTSFSRYFSSIHNKPFIQFLNEIRIGYACKLLIDNKHIGSACYESGFNNISNFNRQFKIIKNMTPSQYVKLIANFS